jgi:hypothetical protein
MIPTDDYQEFPEWHREVLEERERQIAAGEAHFIPWEQAKAEIRELVLQAGESTEDAPNIPRHPGLKERECTDL